MTITLRRALWCTSAFTAAIGFTSCVSMESRHTSWKQLGSLPDPEGFASAFAGVSHDALVIAGGANFPDKRPWDGGTKAWYDGVFVLPDPQGVWITAGRLPRPVAYGVSVSTPSGIVCAGGGDMKEHFRSAFLLTWDGQHVHTESLPDLPGPLAFASGAAVGSKVYLVGGLSKPDATAAAAVFWMLDLAKPEEGWRGLPECPGAARMLAQVGASGGILYVNGGVSLRAGPDGKAIRTYLRDAYAYDPVGGWRRLAEMPHSVAAAPSPMPVSARGELFVISGDDGSRAHLIGPNHPGFLHEVLVYDPVGDRWHVGPPAPISRATAPTAWWRGTWIVASGERKPGYRSPEVWSLTIGP